MPILEAPVVSSLAKVEVGTTVAIVVEEDNFSKKSPSRESESIRIKEDSSLMTTTSLLTRELLSLEK